MKNKLKAILLLVLSFIIFAVGSFVGFFICLWKRDFSELKDLIMFYKAARKDTLKKLRSVK